MLAEGLLYNGDSDFYKRNIERYASVTPAEVKTAMQQWLGRPVLKINIEPGDRPKYVEAVAKKTRAGDRRAPPSARTKSAGRLVPA